MPASALQVAACMRLAISADVLERLATAPQLPPLNITDN